MKVIREKFHNQLVTMPRLFPINCYLIKEQKFMTLIDCSKKGESRKIIDVIQSEGRPLKHIILTHAHSDHIGDVDKIKKVFPKAEIILSEKENQDLNHKERKLSPLPVQVDRLVKEGDYVGSLLVKETPGHTRGSISLIDLRTHFAFVGDLIQTKGGNAIAGDRRVIFPFPAMATQDKTAAIQSFEKISKDQYARYYCGHGSYLENNSEKIQRMIARGNAKIK